MFRPIKLPVNIASRNALLAKMAVRRDHRRPLYPEGLECRCGRRPVKVHSRLDIHNGYREKGGGIGYEKTISYAWHIASGDVFLCPLRWRRKGFVAMFAWDSTITNPVMEDYFLIGIEK